MSLEIPTQITSIPKRVIGLKAIAIIAGVAAVGAGIFVLSKKGKDFFNKLNPFNQANKLGQTFGKAFGKMGKNFQKFSQDIGTQINKNLNKMSQNVKRQTEKLQEKFKQQQKKAREAVGKLPKLQIPKDKLPKLFGKRRN